MNKSDRETIRMKYGGKCGYCGCELTGKWHVDHMSPILRYKESIPRQYIHSVTGSALTAKDLCDLKREEILMYEQQPHKTINKCSHPERNHIDNLMPACASCNINKGGADVEQFRNAIAHGVESINKTHAQYRMAKRFGLIEETKKQVVFYFELLKEK